MTGPTGVFGRKLLLVCMVGVLMGFVQTKVTAPRAPAWNAIASLWSLERSNVADVLPSIEAARRVATGLPLYTSVSVQGASFIYPPVAALPYRPLIHLSREDAAVCLFIFNRALLVLIAAIALRLAGPIPSSALTRLTVLIAAVVLWHPLMRAVELNQATVVVTVLIGAGLWAMRSRRQVLLGVCLALAAAIKPPLILAVPLLYWHARRAAGAAVAAGALLLALSVAYAGWAAHVDYVTRVLPALSDGYAFYANQSWNGLVGRLLYPEAAATFALTPRDGLVRIASVLLGGLTFLFFARRIRSLPRDEAIATEVVGLAWLGATLSSPISWEHHYAPALFCVALLLRRLVSEARRAEGAPAHAFAIAVVLMASYFEVRHLQHPVSLLAASYVWAGAVLLALVWSSALAAGADRTFFAWPAFVRRSLVRLPQAAIVRLDVIALVACSLLAAYLLANLLLFDYGRDQGIYAVVARTMLEGGAPYRDAWDFKPPGVFFVYAIARLLFGQGMHGVRIVEVVGLLSLFPAFAILSRRWVGSWVPALPAVALAVMAYVQLEFWNTGQPESFATFVLAWMLVLATSPAATAADGSWRQRLIWLGIGAAYGGAALLKPQLAGGLLLTPFMIGWARVHAPASPYRRIRAGLESLLFAGLGAAVPILGVVGYFASHGALGWMTETLFGFVPHYSRLGHENRGLLSLLLQGWDESLFRFSRHHAFGILLALALPVAAARERWGLLHVAAALVFPILGVGLQAKFFPYHYGTILPLLALPAGWGVWKLWLRLRSYLVPAVLLVATVLALKDERILPPYGASLWDRNWVRTMAVFGEQEERGRLMALLHTASDVNAWDNLRAAEWIAKSAHPERPIYVWGFEPVLYDLAHRPCSSRYIYNVPQRVPWAGRHRDLLLRDLADRPPEVVVVEERDVFPHVTGDDRDSLGALGAFPDLLRLLRTSYRPGPRFGKLTLLVRH